MSTASQDMVDRIDQTLDYINDPNDEDFRALSSIRRSIINFPEHDDCNSMVVNFSLANERINRLSRRI